VQEETRGDLASEEQVAARLFNFRWQVRGEVAGVAYPRDIALYTLAKQGIRAILSLAEDALPPERLTAYNLQAEHLPIPDFHPPTIPQVEQAIAIINRFLAEDRPVAVHCGAGLGRTGTILACYLVWQGASTEDAIGRVRSLQPGSVETREQEAVVGAYELHLRGSL
jgi:atypical dual specificity phosphatase